MSENFIKNIEIKNFKYFEDLKKKLINLFKGL
jgi:hypothetical protein